MNRFWVVMFLETLLLPICNPVGAQKTVVHVADTVFLMNMATTMEEFGFSQWTYNIKPAIQREASGPGMWMKLHSQGTYSPVLKKPLSEDFDIDFTFMNEVNGDGNNSTEMTLFDRQGSSPLDDDFPGVQGLKMYLGENMASFLCYNNENVMDKVPGENRKVIIPLHDVTTIHIEVRKKKVFLFVNGNKTLEIARDERFQGKWNSFRFHLWDSAAEPFIQNFRILNDNPSSPL